MATDSLASLKLGDDQPNEARASVVPQCIRDLPVENPGRAILTDDQWHYAQNLADKSFVRLDFPRTMKLHVDPPIGGQSYALVSFIPSKGAIPDKDGCFGVAKVRGVFETEAKADSYAEMIIRQHDSYARIDYCWVGKPFPLMVDNTAYAAATREIDIRRKVDETVREEVKRKREEDKQDMATINDRQRALMADVQEDKKESYDDLDYYVTLRTKKAHLTHNKEEMERKIKESDDLIAKCRNEIVQQHRLHHEYREQYIARYKEALASSGIDPTNNPLLQRMIEDGDL